MDDGTGVGETEGVEEAPKDDEGEAVGVTVEKGVLDG